MWMCFISCSVDHLILHSFPTRRSSDLAGGGERRREQHPEQPLGEASTFSAIGNGGLDFPTQSRSEEHTSELQSQSNFVCRLLLEKKRNLFHNFSMTTRMDTSQ